jgi:hypothetical protein
MKMVMKSDKNPGRSVTYVLILVSIWIFSLYLVAEGAALKYFKYTISFPFPRWLFFIGMLLLSTIIYFIYYYKRTLLYYEQKFEGHVLNRIFKSDRFFLILLLVISFILGPTLRVLLFGGGMMGRKVVGILN